MILALQGLEGEEAVEVAQQIKDEAAHCMTTNEPLILILPPGVTLFKSAGRVRDAYVVQPHNEPVQVRIEVEELRAAGAGGYCGVPGRRA